MPNLQMISPINLQSADVVNLFYSPNLLLSQLLEVGKGNFACERVCVYTILYICAVYVSICKYLSVRMCVIVCVNVSACLCVYVDPVPT